MATRTTTYFQDCFTYLQKKIYGTLLPSTKIKNNPKKKSKNTNFEKTPLHLAVAGYIGYYFLFIIGTVFENYWKVSFSNHANKSEFQYSEENCNFSYKKWDFFGDFQTLCLGYIREWLYGIGPVTGPDQVYNAETKSGYAPLYDSFESFYARNVYRRLKHSLHPVVVSVPGAKMKLADRVSDNEFWTCKLANEEAIPPKECINLGSYNYLGFAENR